MGSARGIIDHHHDESRDGRAIADNDIIESEDLVSDNNQGSGMGIVVAAVVGAAVGAGVALLFAPRSGKETRGWLARKGRDVQDRTMTAFEQGKEATLRAAKELGRNLDDAVRTLDRSTYPSKDNGPTRG